MNIKLNNMIIENFKGIKEFNTEFDPKRTVIKAENGVGKTTVYDAFLWLLFGKDSTGRKDFEIRPLDDDNQPIKGLVIAVQAGIELDNVSHVFRKEHHEKVVKKQLRGYETLCWIDEVPKKVSEFAEYIADIIPEDTFKTLTNLRHFSEGIHWTERRRILLDIAGEIGTPEGFDDLIGSLNSRSIEDYKAVLGVRKKRDEKERDEINPRIDEIQKGLTEYAGTDKAALKQNRQVVQADIAELGTKRKQVCSKEKEREDQVTILNGLNAQKVRREAVLESDTGGVENLLKEKTDITTQLSDLKTAAAKTQANHSVKGTEIRSEKSTLESHQRILSKVRADYTRASSDEHGTKCTLCGQALPKDKLEEIEQRRKELLIQIAKQGNDAKKTVKDCTTKIEKLVEQQSEFKKLADRATKEYQEADVKTTIRLAEIAEAIKNRQKTPPEKDRLWLTICEDIGRAEKKLGPPISEQLEAIDSARDAKTEELTELDKALAQADRHKQDAARIKELEAKEKELSQAIAGVEKQLADIDKYTAAQGELIEAAVNDKFKHAKFKLFNQLLNGGLEECCEVTFNGVPHPDMSAGQKIYVGIDIVNVLSAHYDTSIPLFIDHAESLTLPIEATSQIVELHAQKNVTKLTVETFTATQR